MSLEKVDDIIARDPTGGFKPGQLLVVRSGNRVFLVCNGGGKSITIGRSSPPALIVALVDHPPSSKRLLVLVDEGLWTISAYMALIRFERVL